MLQHKILKSNAVISSTVCFRAQMQIRTAGTESWRQAVQDFKHMCGMQLFSATVCDMHSEK